METSETINELATALAKAQAEMHAAAKDGLNTFFKQTGVAGKEKGSSYATLASVWDACREPLCKNGLSVVQLPANGEAGKVSLTTMLMHTSGQFIRETISTRVAKDDAQGIGSGITYLRRYALSAIAGIAAEDDDGNAASAPQQQQQQRPAAKPQQQPQQQKPAEVQPAVPFLDQLESALSERGMADSKCLAGLKHELSEQATAKGKTFDFENPSAAVASAVVKQIAAGKFDHLKEAA